jgi:hypothetical protein
MTTFGEDRAEGRTGPLTRQERTARLLVGCAILASIGWLVALVTTLDGLRVAMDGRHFYAANHVPSTILAAPLVVTILFGAAARLTKTMRVRVLALLLGLAVAFAGTSVWWWSAFVWSA